MNDGPWAANPGGVIPSAVVRQLRAKVANFPKVGSLQPSRTTQYVDT